jgi:hypothetical protein
MRIEGVECDLEIEGTSEGGEKDVRTARVRLRDPATKEVRAEKFSTLVAAATRDGLWPTFWRRMPSIPRARRRFSGGGPLGAWESRRGGSPGMRIAWCWERAVRG